MTSGGQCVMTPGTALMPLWSASNWDMHTLEVSLLVWWKCDYVYVYCVCMQQVAGHTVMPTLVLAVDQYI